jgi:hypothetical protein
VLVHFTKKNLATLPDETKKNRQLRSGVVISILRNKKNCKNDPAFSLSFVGKEIYLMPKGWLC